jgi:enoyl-CoA hydratase
LTGRQGVRLRTQAKDRVLYVTLDHAPVNSLDALAYQEIFEVFNQISEGSDFAAVLLRADHRCFSAGQDRRDAPDPAKGADSYLRHAAQAIVAATLCPVPLVVALESAAIGAGLILAACADILVLDSQASLILPERKFGVIAGYAHLAQWIGAGAKNATLTGEPIVPSTFAYGGALVIPRAEVDARAQQIVQSMADSNSLLMQATKSGWMQSRREIARDYTAEIEQTISLGLMNFSLPMSPETQPDA